VTRAGESLPGGVIELERRIAAPPETVFAYFTDPERYRLWHGVQAELDPRPGGLFRVTMTNRSRQVARGEYVEVDPPHRVVFTWGFEGIDALPPGTSTVEVVLVPDGDDTILHLRHSGLPTEDLCQFHAWGWGFTLERLLVAAAGGDPGPYPHADF
jgi:uncharacterized protein YndB with AHSA1/START domain